MAHQVRQSAEGGRNGAAELVAHWPEERQVGQRAVARVQPASEGVAAEGQVSGVGQLQEGGGQGAWEEGRKMGEGVSERV
jgi:hypothetical protein